MKLTDGERLIVLMLAEMMNGLKFGDEIDPALVQHLAMNGNDWAIRHKYPEVFNTIPPSDADVKETIDILWMWEIIEHAIGKLAGAEAEEAAGWNWSNFGGFDANHDRHQGIANTLINKLGDFSDFKNRRLNSHSQASLPRYRAIYAKFERILGVMEKRERLYPDWEMERDPTFVLVVEDESIIRMMLVDSLEDAGYRVVEAEDADAAIAQLDAYPEIDIVITDIRMPGSMDGLGLARWMRAERPTIPIIIVSGFATPPDVGAINPAIALIVAKPYPPRDAPRWLASLRIDDAPAVSRATTP